MTMTKILIYSHDTYGLGNIRQMLCVARHLVADELDVSVLLLSGADCTVVAAHGGVAPS